MDVRTLCLGVLTLRDMTGYEIKKHFEEHFSHFFGAGYGSIYPALTRLTRERLVACTGVAQDRRPDKKIYSITEAGREALIKTLVATPPRHKVRSEFLVLMYFADLLPGGRLAQVLDQRADDIEALLAHIDCFEEHGRPTPAQRAVAGIGRATLAAQLEYIREHREALITTLAGSHPSVAASPLAPPAAASAPAHRATLGGDG